MRSLIAILCTLLIGHGAFAQISSGGLPLSKMEDMAALPEYSLEIIDNEELKVTELQDDDPNVYRKDFFAKSYPVGKRITNGGLGQWSEIEGRKVWRCKIKSPTALHIALIFDEFHIPEGGSLFFYDENGRQLQGGYTSVNNAADGIFICSFLYGNNVIVEYDHPIGNSALPAFRLRDIIHAYKQLPLGDGRREWGTFGTSLDCHNNVVCEQFNDYCNQIRSVCLIMTPYTYSWGNCSGTTIETRWSGGSGALINNSYNDFRPYVLTARHVIWHMLDYYWCVFDYSTTHGYSNLKETLFYFNYQSRICDPTLDVRSDHVQFVRGCGVLEDEPGWPAGTDLALLELNVTPPIQFNTFYSGWNRQSKDDLPSWAVTGIHHPRRDVKKISKGNLHYSGAYPTFWGVDWYSGGTEPGSSGSPLFCDADKRIIGALSWGLNENCDDHNEQDRYGRLRDFWGKAEEHLSPDDHGRETYDGADPATFCQRHIEINGLVLPTALYHEGRPSMTIQASQYIDVANMAPTVFETALTFRPKFDIKAGNAINIIPTTTNTFETDLGSVVIFEIQGCERTTGCEVEFNTQRKMVRPENNTGQATASSISSKVFPNPAKDIVNITFQQQAILTITDMQGSKLFERELTQNEGTFTLGTATYAPGVYFVTLRYKNGQTETHKVEIIR